MGRYRCATATAGTRDPYDGGDALLPTASATTGLDQWSAHHRVATGSPRACSVPLWNPWSWSTCGKATSRAPSCDCYHFQWAGYTIQTRWYGYIKTSLSQRMPRRTQWSTTLCALYSIANANKIQVHIASICRSSSWRWLPQLYGAMPSTRRLQFLCCFGRSGIRQWVGRPHESLSPILLDTNGSTGWRLCNFGRTTMRQLVRGQISLLPDWFWPQACTVRGISHGRDMGFQNIETEGHPSGGCGESIAAIHDVAPSDTMVGWRHCASRTSRTTTTQGGQTTSQHLADTYLQVHRTADWSTLPAHPTGVLGGKVTQAHGFDDHCKRCYHAVPLWCYWQHAYKDIVATSVANGSSTQRARLCNSRAETVSTGAMRRFERHMPPSSSLCGACTSKWWPVPTGVSTVSHCLSCLYGRHRWCRLCFKIPKASYEETWEIRCIQPPVGRVLNTKTLCATWKKDVCWLEQIFQFVPIPICDDLSSLDSGIQGLQNM